MAKVPAHVLKRIQERPQDFPLPLEPAHGWRGAPDEGGHTHCEACRATVDRGAPVVGCYLEYVSVVFCPVCVADNQELFQAWLAPRTRPGCIAEPDAPTGRGS